MQAQKFEEYNALDHWNDEKVYTLAQTYVVDKTQHSWSINCWKLSLWERIKLLFTGRIWTLRTDRIAVITLEKDDLVPKKEKHATT